MAQRKSNTPLIVGVVAAALFGMAGLNRMQHDIRPRTQAEIDKEIKEQEERSKPAAAVATPAPDELLAPDEELAALPAEIVFAKPRADREVTIGYQWSPEVQAAPEATARSIRNLLKLLKMIDQHLEERVRYRIVNCDALPEVPLGICLDGERIGEFHPGQVERVEQQIMQTITSKVRGTFAPRKKKRIESLN